MEGEEAGKEERRIGGGGEKEGKSTTLKSSKVTAPPLVAVLFSNSSVPFASKLVCRIYMAPPKLLWNLLVPVKTTGKRKVNSELWLMA